MEETFKLSATKEKAFETKRTSEEQHISRSGSFCLCPAIWWRICWPVSSTWGVYLLKWTIIQFKLVVGTGGYKIVKDNITFLSFFFPTGGISTTL